MLTHTLKGPRGPLVLRVQGAAWAVTRLGPDGIVEEAIGGVAAHHEAAKLLAKAHGRSAMDGAPLHCGSTMPARRRTRPL